MTQLYINKEKSTSAQALAAGGSENCRAVFDFGNGGHNVAPTSCAIFIRCGALGGTAPSVTFTAYTQPADIGDASKHRFTLDSGALNADGAVDVLLVDGSKSPIMGGGLIIEAVAKVSAADETYADLVATLVSDNGESITLTDWIVF